MEAPILSVIIPAHNHPEILRKTLEHLERQTIADQIEVIIVNDGEKLTLRQTQGKSEKLDLRILDVPPCHQGTARNIGAKLAHGKYVMFIGDDIFLAPDACEKHVHSLDSRFSDLRFAVLGFTTWDPACGITPTMRWLERTGWQFGYPMIKRHAHHFLPSRVQHRFTYTSHISLPTKIARKFPFREYVTLYGWEDIEWGLRLKNAGVKLLYEPGATALHHHHITLKDSLKRMETLGRSAVVMERLVPELKLVPRGWKKRKYRIAAMLPGMRGAHARSFLQGLAA
ncbi:MAG: glycosyltransferase family 2 protein [Candidatus Peribacteraceae bacterium]|nr:glycosyltransferase family 2 protein [Candidatus Peribacteraceae bacterium]